MLIKWVVARDPSWVALGMGEGRARHPQPSFRPTGQIPRAPWSEASAAPGMEALPGREAFCFKPNKGPVTVAGQLGAAGPLRGGGWGGGGQAWCEVVAPCPSFTWLFHSSQLVVAP